jgi:hypothetical protein
MPYHRRRRRFGHRGPRAVVTQSTAVLKRKSKCRGCGQTLNVGESVTRLRLRKSVAVVGCVTCSRRLVKLKNFHPACCPADINKAMGYDPAAHASQPVPPSHSVPPPPRPKTTTDLKIDAILMMEAALAAGIRDRSIPKGPELDSELNKLNGLKQRIVRGSTPGESDAAANVTLKRLVDIVFGGRK